MTCICIWCSQIPDLDLKRFIRRVLRRIGGSIYYYFSLARNQKFVFVFAWSTKQRFPIISGRSPRGGHVCYSQNNEPVTTTFGRNWCDSLKYLADGSCVLGCTHIARMCTRSDFVYFFLPFCTVAKFLCARRWAQ